MRLHGLSKQAWNRYAGGSWRYDIVAPGYKYNLTDIAAAMGVVQLSRAQEMAGRREDIAKLYTEAFLALSAFRCPAVPRGRVSSWHLYMLRLRHGTAHQRDDMIDDLKRRGVGTSMHFIPLHMHSYYRDTFGFRPDDFPVAHLNSQQEISLPIYSSMSDADVERVILEVTTVGKELS
jgi:perosamine synthetase